MVQTIDPWALGAIDSQPRAGRLAVDLLAEGVADLAGNGWLVQQQAAADMTVRVGSGAVGDAAYVAGDAAAGQGLYAVRNRDAWVGSGNSDVALTASDPTNDRHDLVVLRVYDDAEDSSGVDGALVEVVNGTPAAVPNDPPVPDTALVLARVVVQAGATSITDADIVDLRTQAIVGDQYLGDVPSRLAAVEDRVIAVQSGDGSSDTITFDNLPQTFTHLEFIGHSYLAGGGSNDVLNVRFNNDSGADQYKQLRLLFDGTGSVNASSNELTRIPLAAGARGSFDVSVRHYTIPFSPVSYQFNSWTTAGANPSSTDYEGRIGGGRYVGNGPVTRVDFELATEVWAAATRIVCMGVG